MAIPLPRSEPPHDQRGPDSEHAHDAGADPLAGRPHATQSLTGPQDASRTGFRDVVRCAAQRLHGAGWRVRYVQLVEATPWHIMASNGTKWRVVQVLAPGASANMRQEGRQMLGSTVMVPARLGTMEQWLAHIRPGGRIAFGTDLLSGYAWAGDDTSSDTLRDRLGRLAVQAGALTPSETRQPTLS